MKVFRRFLVVLALVGICFAICPPSNVTCAEDGQSMWATGRTRTTPAGYTEYEFTHTYLVPGTVGEVGHHYAWVPCDPSK